MKKWLTEHFLPMWAKETVLADNRVLQKENEKLKLQIRELEAYVQGIQAGLRAGKKIHIYNKGGTE